MYNDCKSWCELQKSFSSECGFFPWISVLLGPSSPKLLLILDNRFNIDQPNLKAEVVITLRWKLLRYSWVGNLPAPSKSWPMPVIFLKAWFPREMENPPLTYLWLPLLSFWNKKFLHPLKMLSQTAAGKLCLFLPFLSVTEYQLLIRLIRTHRSLDSL